MSNKPSIYAPCKAGCLWETVHKEDFEKSASIVRVYPDERGVVVLKQGKDYKIFCDKANGKFTAGVDIYVDDELIDTITVDATDKYANSFTFRCLDAYESGEVCYEAAGLRYVIQIGTFDERAAVDLRVTCNEDTCVYIYNADATIKGEKGEKGEKGDTPQKGIDYWTEEDKKEIEANVEELINAKIGGIETALDSVIALQNSLIGGNV